MPGEPRRVGPQRGPTGARGRAPTGHWKYAQRRLNIHFLLELLGPVLERSLGSMVSMWASPTAPTWPGGVRKVPRLPEVGPWRIPIRHKEEAQGGLTKMSEVGGRDRSGTECPPPGNRFRFRVRVVRARRSCVCGREERCRLSLGRSQSESLSLR